MPEAITEQETQRVLSRTELDALKATHPWWQANAQKWKEAEDVLYNQVDSKKEEYLTRGEDENPNTWEKRKKKARFKGELAPVLHRMVGAVFMRPPSRREATLGRWGDFIKNVDGCGTHLDSFMEDRIFNALGFGADLILVDRPPIDPETGNTTTEVVSQEFMPTPVEREVDPMEIRLVPYRIYDMTNWSTDSQGEAQWIRLREKRIEQPDPLGEPESVTVYREYDRTAWRVFEVRMVGDEEMGVMVDSGSHNLGLVPLAVVGIHKVKPMCFMSPMQSAVNHDLEAFESSADLSWDSWKHAHPTLLDKRDGKAQRVSVGPDSKIKLDVNQDEDVRYLAPPADIFGVLRQKTQDSIDGTKRLSGVDSLSGSSDAQSMAASGRSRAVSFSISEERHLKRASRVLTKAEKQIFELGERWVSDREDLGSHETLNEAQPAYPQIFSHAGTEALIDQWLATRNEINSEAYDKEFQARIVNSALGDIDREKLEEILKQIRENPVQSAAMMEDVLQEPDLAAGVDVAGDAMEEADEELQGLGPEDLE